MWQRNSPYCLCAVVPLPGCTSHLLYASIVLRPVWGVRVNAYQAFHFISTPVCGRRAQCSLVFGRFPRNGAVPRRTIHYWAQTARIDASGKGRRLWAPKIYLPGREHFFSRQAARYMPTSRGGELAVVSCLEHAESYCSTLRCHRNIYALHERKENERKTIQGSIAIQQNSTIDTTVWCT